MMLIEYGGLSCDLVPILVCLVLHVIRAFMLRKTSLVSKSRNATVSVLRVLFENGRK